MIVHSLKTLLPYWDAMQRQEKNFEVRRDDRGFQKGDVLECIRHDGLNVVYQEDLPNNCDLEGCEHPNEYLLYRRITYILTGGQFGIEPGHVIMGLEPMDPQDFRERWEE